MLLGMWLAGGLFMFGVAIGGFQVVDTTLAEPDPSANQMVKVLGKHSARTLLRHQVSELNRFFIKNWERAQLCLGVLLLLTMLFDTNGDKFYMGVCGFLLLLALSQHFLLTPHITALGRAVDFIPEQEPALERTQLWRFHYAYAAAEAVKFLVVAGFSVRLLVVSHRRRSRKNVDLVDNSDNG